MMREHQHLAAAIARLQSWAQEALEHYGKETAGGGEPHFPQAAQDVLDVCAVVAAQSSRSEKAKAAIAATLRRIKEDPRVAYYICPMTQTYDLLLAAHCELHELDESEFRSKFEPSLRFDAPKAAAPVVPPNWNEYLRISELPEVDECIRNLIADSTEDNAVCVVRAVLEAVALSETRDPRPVAKAGSTCCNHNCNQGRNCPLRSTPSKRRKKT